jgi:hypothetical protein
MAKRKYLRRSDEELIADLEGKIRQVQQRMESKQRRDSAVLKELPKIQRSLRRFAQLATDHGREDLSNSTIAFLAGLERAAQSAPETPGPRRRGREASYEEQA